MNVRPSAVLVGVVAAVAGLRLLACAHPASWPPASPSAASVSTKPASNTKGDSGAAESASRGAGSPGAGSPGVGSRAAGSRGASRPVRRAPPYDAAILVAGGHVLLPSKDLLHDWDPASEGPLRQIALGSAGPAHTFTYAPVGGTRFVVARTNEQDVVAFDLWDAAKLTKVRTLAGTLVAETPVVDFARDGSRLLVLGCAAARAARSDCEVAVYALPDGALVHRTRLGSLAQTESRIEARLSPTGRYFAISGDFPTAAHDARSGERVFVADSGGHEATVNHTLLRFVFVDDRRLLTTADDGGRQVLTDLAARRPVAMVDFKMKHGAGHEALGVDLSPDHEHASTLLVRPGADGRDEFEVGIFNFRHSSPSFRTPVPTSDCDSACTLQWVEPSVMTAHTPDADVPRRLRIEATTENTVDEPSAPPRPFLAFGVQEVEGDFDTYGTTPTKWHENAGALVTPSGRRIDLATLGNGGIDGPLLSAVGDRFLLDGQSGLEVLMTDGTMADLARPPPEE